MDVWMELFTLSMSEPWSSPPGLDKILGASCKDSIGWMFSKLDTSADLFLDQMELAAINLDKYEVCIRPFFNSKPWPHPERLLLDFPSKPLHCILQLPQECLVEINNLHFRNLGQIRFPIESVEHVLGKLTAK